MTDRMDRAGMALKPAFLSARYRPCLIAAILSAAFPAVDPSGAHASAVLAAVVNAPGPSVPEFLGGRSAVSNEGYHTLAWTRALSEGSDSVYELQRASGPGFADAATVYRGRETETFVSGLLDGDYHYRVRATADGGRTEWSAPFILEVRHYGLATAWSLFAMGAVIFLAILAVLIRGARASSDDGFTS